MRQNRSMAQRLGIDQDIYQVWVPLASVPQPVRDAIIVSQDEQFFYHRGFEKTISDTSNRFVTPLDTWRRQRNSLTNQLVRSLFLGQQRNDAWYLLRERLLTSLAETYLSKNRILELYLNTVQLGPGIYGIEQGARHHFGMPVHRLTLEQSCRLAVIIDSPQTLRVYQETVTHRAAQLAEKMGYSNYPVTSLSRAKDGMGGVRIAM